MASIRRIGCVVAVVMVLGGGVGPERAQASGIPTVDVLSVGQQLISYITDLSQFAEVIAQTGLETEHLATTLADYAQTLKEYQSYLNQLRSLQDFISAKDWAGLMTIIVGSPYGEELMGQIPLISLTDPDYADKARKLLEKYGGVPQKTEDILAAYKVLGSKAKELQHIEEYNEKLNEQYGKHVAQLNITSRNEAGIKAREETWAKFGKHILNLGEESDLATAQLGVSQANVAGLQREAMMRQINQQMLIYESPSTALANRRASMVDDELGRLKKVHANSENFKAGKSHWGN